MIKCNLSSLMGRDRKNIQDVCNETGLARNTVANLYHDRAKRVDYETMDKLCRMFQCTIGELYEFDRQRE
ncbi:MAG: helix-turn-helix transcriptional regulator [Lachnospiraceae bacterium]|nr:helix-turn-helix transcriptional regulator [Lachnospiraceae bacterium]